MFEGINSLLTTLTKFNAIDAQCQTLSDEMQDLLPELTDNAMAVQFAKDSIVELNGQLSEMRKGLEAAKEHVSPVIEEPEPVTIKADFKLSPEEDAALVETEKTFSEPVEDDESDVIIEAAPGSIFPIEEDESPIPDFEEQKSESHSLCRVEDWDELYIIKVEDLVSSGAEKEARKLKQQCLEIRNVMYSEDGDLTSAPISDLSKAAQSVWKAALAEVSYKEDIEEIPEQLNTLEKFNSLVPLFVERAKELGSQYKADEIELYCQSIAKAKYDSSGNFIGDKNKQGSIELEESSLWAQMSDGMQEMIDLMSADIPDYDEEETAELIEKFSEDEDAVSEVDAMLADLEEGMDKIDDTDEQSDEEEDDDELAQLLEGLE